MDVKIILKNHLQEEKFFSMYTISLFKDIENQNGFYRSKDSLKNIFESLIQPGMEITNFKK